MEQSAIAEIRGVNQGGINSAGAATLQHAHRVRSDVLHDGLTQLFYPTTRRTTKATSPVPTKINVGLNARPT